MDWQAVRDEFPITRNYNFQDHAAVAPLCRPAAEAARRFLEQSEHSGYLAGGFYKHADHVRQRAATLINANAEADIHGPIVHGENPTVGGQIGIRELEEEGLLGELRGKLT